MRFNTLTAVKNKLMGRSDATVNHEKGLAFKPDAQMALYLRTCAGFLEDSFYVAGATQLAELRKVIHQCERSFVLKMAHYARVEMHLRTLPLVLLAEASVMHSGESNESKADVRAYVPKIIQRADEPAELLAYWIQVIGQGQKRNLPNALKKGLSDALLKFDEYQFAKYNRKGDVKLKDVLQLVHAKPDSPERAALYKRILEDKLATPETWEVKISTKGSDAQNWNAIAPKMGIMALVRNLRNFEKHGAQEALRHAVNVITHPEKVKRSKLLPFRWLAAEREVSSAILRDALREAVELSVANMPRWTGSTAIFVDTSGSMTGRLSRKSSLQYLDVAALMGAMAMHVSDKEYVVGVFGTEYKEVKLSKRDSILTNAQKIRQVDVGWATHAYKAIQALRKAKRSVDRMVIFSDMQCYDSCHGGQSLAQEWIQYQREVNPQAVLYSIDLASYGSLQWPQDSKQVVQVAGWSDKVLDLILTYENRADALALIQERY